MSLLRRALTGTFATVLLAGGLVAGAATPAAAAPSDNCVEEGSTRLFTANDGDFKLWVDTAVGTTTRDYHLCFGAGDVVRGDLVVRTPLTSSVTPAVSYTLADPACPRLIELQDPVQLMTRFAETLGDNPGYVCFGVANGAYRVTLGTPTEVFEPNAVLLLDRFTTVGDAYCDYVAPNSADCRYGYDLIIVNIV